MTTRTAPGPADRPRQAEPQDAQNSPWPPWKKWVASALIALHVTAVFWAPFAFVCNAGDSSSPLARPVFGVLRPYMQALYLDHGYAFFAPNPSASHLVEYKVEFADGREPVTGRFPDLVQQQPRLLYHRHFMLAEALHNSFAPSQAPPEPTAPSLKATAAQRAQFRSVQLAYQANLAAWQHQRRQYEAMWQSFEEHLKHEYGGSKVTLTRIEHRPATPAEVEQLGRKLNAPESYRNLPKDSLPEDDAPVGPRPEAAP